MSRINPVIDVCGGLFFLGKVAVLDPLVAQQVAAGEVVDRLVLLNHERYVEEVEQGLHDETTKKGKARKRTTPKANSGTTSFFGEEA